MVRSKGKTSHVASWAEQNRQNSEVRSRVSKVTVKPFNKNEELQEMREVRRSVMEAEYGIVGQTMIFDSNAKLSNA